MPNYLHNRSVTYTYLVVGLQTTAVRIDLSTNISKSQYELSRKGVVVATGRTRLTTWPRIGV